MGKNIEQFVKDHGHNFHSQVVQRLRNYGWTVLVSPFYRDNGTDKAREADIIAEKEISFGMNGESTTYHGFFRVRLIVECKFITESIIFWFDDRNFNSAEERIKKDIPYFESSSKNDSILGHHWMSLETVAKLFATYSQNRQEKQQENELIFSSIDKTLNCLINYCNQPSIIPNNKRLAEESRLDRGIINYPVIICNDFSKFFKTTIGNSEGVKKLTAVPNFEIEVNYEYVRYIAGMRKNYPEYFLVDVVDFNKLEDYLKILRDKDLMMALRFIK